MAETETQRELWGGETRKAVENFPVSGEPIPAPVARWLGRIKAAAARVNAELGLLDADKAERIAAAADRVASGELDDQFPIDVFQTGSGTSSNMNANEVIAALAGGDVHPNDDVNMGQSSNDVFPSAVHLAALDELTHDLLPALGSLAEALEAKAREFDDVVKSGRTHLMDADPFEGQAARDALVEVSGALNVVAVSLTKIANDLRWMGSGPRAGLAEIRLPDLQPGSSIMPAKVNPVIPEVVTQVGAQVIGNDASITFAGSQGNFELNVFVPLIARNIRETIELLASAC